MCQQEVIPYPRAIVNVRYTMVAFSVIGMLASVSIILLGTWVYENKVPPSSVLPRSLLDSCGLATECGPELPSLWLPPWCSLPRAPLPSPLPPLIAQAPNSTATPLHYVLPQTAYGKALIVCAIIFACFMFLVQYVG